MPPDGGPGPAALRARIAEVLDSGLNATDDTILPTQAPGRARQART